MDNTVYAPEADRPGDVGQRPGNGSGRILDRSEGSLLQAVENLLLKPESEAWGPFNWMRLDEPTQLEEHRPGLGLP